MNNCLTFNSLVLVYVYNSLDDLHHRISTEECYFTFFFSFFSMSCIFHIKQITDYNNYTIKQIKNLFLCLKVVKLMSIKLVFLDSLCCHTPMVELLIHQHLKRPVVQIEHQLYFVTNLSGLLLGLLAHRLFTLPLINCMRRQ